jgi:iron complex transport system substrate-binding protein
MRTSLNTIHNPMDSLKIFMSLMVVLITGCSTGDNKREIKSFRVNNENTGAKRFKLDQTAGYTKLTIINPWQGADNVTQCFYLVKRGAKYPEGIDSAVVIYVPVKKVVCMSTTHIAMISALGTENTISGVSGIGFIYSANLNKNIEKRQIADVGYESSLNKELILKLSPDLIMMYGIGSESVGYVSKVKELGIKVIFNADYLETDPLSKMEWIKVFGALYCKEKLADSIYDSEVDNYNKLKSYISRNITYRPKVLLGLPYKDTWYVSPGNSFASKLIEDAGGDYLWKNTESSVSMPYGIENVYLTALNADFWLNTGSARDKSEISLADQRLSDLPCFRKGNLFNNNNRMTVNGGNDYWESGSVYPHLILKDIATILHPELFNDKELFFYHKIY